MSRPRWSVPSQCSAFGRPSVYVASVAIGSCVCSQGASTAVTSMIAVMAPPAAPSGLRRMNRPSVVPHPGRAGAPTTTRSTGTPTGLATIAHARVEHAVEHVDEEVAEDHHDGDEHHEVLHDRVVAPQDRLHEEPCDAGQVEDGLGHHETADEERELDADDGDHGQDRVLERVVPDDHALRLPLGPCGADVVLAHDLEQRGAGDAHDEGRGAVADGERGQHELD